MLISSVPHVEIIYLNTTEQKAEEYRFYVTILCFDEKAMITSKMLKTYSDSCASYKIVLFLQAGVCG